MPRIVQRPLVSFGLLAITLAVTAACSGGSTASPQSQGPAGSVTPVANSHAASLVPASVKSKGTLVVATDASYVPNEFVGKDGTTIEGMDADLAKAIGQTLGLQVTVVPETLDGILPGIQSGKYDLGMSSIADTEANERTVDFVDYFKAGTSFFTKTNGGPAITGLGSLCGLNVAVERGTSQQADATRQARKCLKHAQPRVTVDTYENAKQVDRALSSGQDKVAMADTPVAAYQVKRSAGLFTLVGEPYGVEPYGIALPKGNGMTQPVQAALEVLIANGRYDQILSKWGVQAGAITHPTINGAAATGG